MRSSGRKLKQHLIDLSVEVFMAPLLFESQTLLCFRQGFCDRIAYADWKTWFVLPRCYFVIQSNVRLSLRKGVRRSTAHSRLTLRNTSAMVSIRCALLILR